MNSPVPQSRDRRWARLLVIAFLAVVAGIPLYIHFRKGSHATPPDPAPESMELAVANAVRASRDRVVKEPNSSAAWGELGEVFLANEMEEEARLCFEEAGRLEPGSGRWCYFRAIISINRGDRDAALPFLQHTVELGTKGGREDIAPWLVLAEQLLLLGRAAEAAPYIQRILQRKPDEVRGHFDAGLLAIAQQDFPKARESLEKCLNSRFARKKSLVQLSAVCLRLDNSRESERYRAEAERTPTDAEWEDPVVTGYLTRAVKKRSVFKAVENLEAQGRFSEAIRMLTPVASDFPDDDVVQMTIGRLLAQMGDYPEAESALRRAQSLAPLKVQPHYYLSLVLIEEGKAQARAGNKARAAALFAEGETSARRALETKPDYGFAQMALGLALKGQGRIDQAALALAEAVRCTPEQAEMHYQFAEVLADLDRTDQAILRFEQALRLAPPGTAWKAPAEARLAKLRQAAKK